MDTYIDEGFRARVTERATVAFRVIFGDRHQVRPHRPANPDAGRTRFCAAQA